MNQFVRSPSTAAERMRAHRDRRRRGMRCLWVELRATEIDTIVSVGLIKPDARNDINAVRDGFYAFLDRALRPTS
jgi:hypothetical protein